MVVNENPNTNYAKTDSERTPDLSKCFAALKDDEILMPRGVLNAKIWEDSQYAARECAKKVEGSDYRIVEQNGKPIAVMLVDGAIPKVRPFILTPAVAPAACLWLTPVFLCCCCYRHYCCWLLLLLLLPLAPPLAPPPVPPLTAWFAARPLTTCLPLTVAHNSQVHRTAMWLSYLNYKLGAMEPVAESPFATV